ncbi:hypothetical protein S4054249_08300 [Pseudoalteromonas luteoviolacea]|uniref:Uncharacterized protein n=1 Tax=Pseudoalteromonas luteoviolacea S4054 TaxID=1129367 RepID=A0A0F6A891_9GAMM|nr:hypothetical protein S4054249_08300 [Pseudoalteromonas luteoviolacea]AOT12758.1 hypothetical protein S40542_08300 [Pseudoalteromonas luteoviolacea]AOT17671.1 hypothetical protein S4054_08295 [Pseudoalteromonas luteoviolacea]KKE82333.1 hypothetical protein N479_19020 [Pseudoalteromonas luteoviolacea S4054]KZN78985.1 hypothetical protein N481_00650 [Pseudoalteromonas luteoviolacea S4047-1]
MKTSFLIVLSVVAILAFFIQLKTPFVVTPLYILLLCFALFAGQVLKDINIFHTSLFLLTINSLNYIIFISGLIDLTAIDNDYLSQGTYVFGVQLIVNFVAFCVFIFRVQLSRLISSSNNIKLTYFDALYHWYFLFLMLVCFLALIENYLRIALDFTSTFVYDTFELLHYLPWSLTCGTLLAMIIYSIKEKSG